MKVEFNFAPLAQIHWYEYATRFILGGAVTVIAGLLAKKFGPAFGGLFLAFPAIFPAGATLLEKHETEKKQKAGITNSVRGPEAAALDARGAAMGGMGLACFALIVWKLLPVWDAATVLALAIVAWLSICLSLWWLNKKYL
ncbi:MAG TPA: DUF3147 family protein [Candidatus Acidoferrales bacterium]|nr:DUF3147 family protein [Candidatus Acidoferrales bacterium]